MAARVLTRALAFYARAFPPRQLLFRSRGEVRYMKLSPAIQVTGTLTLLGTVLWLGFATLSVMFPESTVAAKNRYITDLTKTLRGIAADMDRQDREITGTKAELAALQQKLASAEAEKARLSGEVARLSAEADAVDAARRQAALALDAQSRQAQEFANLTHAADPNSQLAQALAARDAEARRAQAAEARLAELSVAAGRAATLVEENRRLAADRDEQVATLAGLQAKLASLEAGLEGPGSARVALPQLKRERDDARQEVAELKVELNVSQADLTRAHQENAWLSQSFDEVSGALKTAVSQRAENDRMREEAEGRNRRLQAQVAALEVEQSEFVERLERTTLSSVSHLETVISATGLKVDDLLSRSGLKPASGIGGPLIALTPSELSRMNNKTGEEDFIDRLARLGDNLTHLAQLRGLVARLPIGAPLKVEYETMSGFGPRVDPFTRQPAMHEGMDLVAERKTPVYATGAGVVVTAGRNGEYGNMVDIDHGHGIVTRYGHLDKINVEEGQKVTTATVVGLLGNTGRSTGAHLHYEVRLDDRPRNPVKFVKASRDVQQGQGK